MQTKPAKKEPDLSSNSFISNPYPAYKILREQEAPYWYNDNGMWLFTRYDDAASILKESKRTTNNITPFLPEKHASPLKDTILQSDPPEHTRRRQFLTKHFKHQKVLQLKPRIEQIVDEYIESVGSKRNIDFMSDFANDIPFILIAELMGIPEVDHARFFNWSRQLTAGLDYMTNNDDDRAQQKVALTEMHEYFSDWLHHGYQAGKNTITYDLLQAYQSKALEKTELLSMLVLLLIAGHENITSTIGNGMLTLIEHPEQKKILREQPQLIGSAIDEILRFETPIQRASLRIVTGDFTVRSQHFYRGDIMSVILGAANRDPAYFKNPELFDIGRTPNKHLAFGSGLHTCLGASLGRMQTEIVFTRVLKQWPDIHLNDKPYQWRHSTIFRGLQSLPVSF